MDYDPAIRAAHDQAALDRRGARTRVKQRFEAAMALELQKEFDRINEPVAALIQERMAAGVSRTEVRKSLRSSKTEVFDQYFKFIDVPKTEPEEETEETGVPREWFAPENTLVLDSGAKIDFYYGKVQSGEETGELKSARVLRMEFPGEETYIQYLAPTTLDVGEPEQEDIRAMIEKFGEWGYNTDVDWRTGKIPEGMPAVPPAEQN